MEHYDWEGEYTDVTESMADGYCTKEWAVNRLQWIADSADEQEYIDAANMTLEEINNGEWFNE